MKKKAYSFIEIVIFLPLYTLEIRLSMRCIGRQAWYQLGILPECPKGTEGFFPHLPEKTICLLEMKVIPLKSFPLLQAVRRKSNFVVFLYFPSGTQALESRNNCIP